MTTPKVGIGGVGEREELGESEISYSARMWGNAQKIDGNMSKKMQEAV